jgi:DNA-binding winged helix-turn-helix (wHTH) protein
LRISKYEFVLLREFLERPQTIIPHSFLVAAVWPNEFQTGNRALPVYVHRLNRILSNASNQAHYIQNVRGKGYEFNSTVRVLALEL